MARRNRRFRSSRWEQLTIETRQNTRAADSVLCTELAEDVPGSPVGELRPPVAAAPGIAVFPVGEGAAAEVSRPPPPAA